MIVLLVVVAVVVVLAGAAWHYRTLAIEIESAAQLQLEHARRMEAARSERERRFREVVVRRDSGLPLEGALDPRRAGIAVRDFIYRMSKVAPEGTPRPSDTRYLAVSAGKQAHLCGGMADAYAWAMNAIGVPVRIVQLATQNFLDGKDPRGTHVTVEIWYEDDWHVSDPTFNVSWNCSDGQKELSIPKLRDCLARGHRILPRPGPTQIRGTRAGRTVQEYHTPYASLLAAYSRTPAIAGGVSHPLDEHPYAGWAQPGKSRP